MSEDKIPESIPNVEIGDAKRIQGAMRIELPLEREFRVSGTTNVKQLAFAISKTIENGEKPILTAIGVQSVSQAIKAVAISNGLTASKGIMLSVIPAFEDRKLKAVESEEAREITVIRLALIPYRF